MRIVSVGAYKRQFTVSHRLLSLINYLTKWRQLQIKEEKLVKLKLSRVLLALLPCS